MYKSKRHEMACKRNFAKRRLKGIMANIDEMVGENILTPLEYSNILTARGEIYKMLNLWKVSTRNIISEVDR